MPCRRIRIRWIGSVDSAPDAGPRIVRIDRAVGTAGADEAFVEVLLPGVRVVGSGTDALVDPVQVGVQERGLDVEDDGHLLESGQLIGMDELRVDDAELRAGFDLFHGLAVFLDASLDRVLDRLQSGFGTGVADAVGRGLQTVLVRLIHLFVQSGLGDDQDALVAGIVVVVFQQSGGSGAEGTVRKDLERTEIGHSERIALLFLSQDGLVVHLFEADAHSDGEQAFLVQFSVNVDVFEEVPDLRSIGVHHGDAHAGNVLEHFGHGLLAEILVQQRIGNDVVEQFGSLFAHDAVGIAVLVQLAQAAFAEDVALADTGLLQSHVVRGDFVQAASLDDDRVIRGDHVEVICRRHSVFDVLPLGLVVVGALDPGACGDLGALRLQLFPGFRSRGAAGQVDSAESLAVCVEVQVGIAQRRFHGLALQIDAVVGFELFQRFRGGAGPEDLALVDCQRFYGVVFFDERVDFAVNKQFVNFLFHVSPLKLE